MGGVAMSLINKMLQDLEARQPAGVADLSATAAVRKPTGRRFSLGQQMLVVLLLVTTVAAAWAVGRHMALPVAPTQHASLAMAPAPQPAPAPDKAGNRETLPFKQDNDPSTLGLPSADTLRLQPPSATPAIGKDATNALDKNGSSEQGFAPDFSATSITVAQEKSPPRPVSGLAAPVAAPIAPSATVAAGPMGDKDSRASQSATFRTLPRAAPAESNSPAVAPAVVQTIQKQMTPPQQSSVSEPLATYSQPALPEAADSAQRRALEQEAGAFGIPVGVSKEVTPSTPKQRADDEYRRATVLAQQGRANEAMASLEQALAQDGSHQAARQTLVGLLLEQQRQQDAVRVLQEGLALDRSQTGLAMLLARLQVERAALQAAIQTLEASQGAARKPDYHAFLAALYQRAGQHQQAMESYRQALRQSPQNGLWWMGLAISLQASNQTENARSAFLRAQDSGMLSSELEAFVRQRLGQLS